MPGLELSNTLAGYGTVALQAGSVALFVALLFPSFVPGWKRVFINRWGFWIAFLLVAAASIITLYYSEFLEQEPCGLCWMQRAFLYPQVVLFGIAAVAKDRSILPYTAALSVAGALIALYQHYLQMGGYDILPCPASGPSADCAARTLFEFGYITFPLMAFSLFIFLILFVLFMRSAATEQKSPLA